MNFILYHSQCCLTEKILFGFLFAAHGVVLSVTGQTSPAASWYLLLWQVCSCFMLVKYSFLLRRFQKVCGKVYSPFKKCCRASYLFYSKLRNYKFAGSWYEQNSWLGQTLQNIIWILDKISHSVCMDKELYSPLLPSEGLIYLQYSTH